MGAYDRGKKKKKNPKFQKDITLTSVLDEHAPFPFVEAYKTLRTNLEFISNTSQTRSIVVTSALPEESKSTVSLNLAMTLGNSGKSVVVVECDLRKPTMRRYLKLERGAKGLSALLAGTAELDQCIQYVESRGIYAIPAGTIPPNPSELLNQQRMRDLIVALKEQFDYVILDAPPVSIVTDAAVVGRMADGALLVVRSRFAPTTMVRLALQRLKSVDIRVLGVVLTRFSPKKSGWRSGYTYENYEYGYHQPRSGK